MSYNHEVMLKLKRQKDEKPAPISIDDVIIMLQKAVTFKVRFVKELAIRRAREWTLELIASSRYTRPIKRKIEVALSNIGNLSIAQKEEARNLFCQFLNNHKPGNRVTLT